MANNSQLKAMALQFALASLPGFIENADQAFSSDTSNNEAKHNMVKQAATTIATIGIGSVEANNPGFASSIDSAIHIGVALRNARVANQMTAATNTEELQPPPPPPPPPPPTTKPKRKRK